MKLYCAPMEGLTGYIFRNAHHDFFPGTDAYFSPFVSVGTGHCFTARGTRDLWPENNRGIPLIPQLLTNNAANFLEAANALADLGYTEVNLNLGCPSGTVVSKGKGSGFLGHPDELDRFLEDVYTKAPFPVSLKVRIGVKDVSETDRLFEIFRRYPVAELTIHPRLTAEKYKGAPHTDIFDAEWQRFPYPVCFNGDLVTAEQISTFADAHPSIHAVMLGRGLIANPGLIRQVQTGQPLSKTELRAFYERLAHDYLEAIPGERTMLFRMKELSLYMVNLFPDSAKHAKKLRKASTLADFNAAVDRLFEERELVPSAGFTQDTLFSVPKNQ